MPKGETVGNIVIDGKGGSAQAKEVVLKKRGNKEANEGRGNEYNRGRAILTETEAEAE